MARGDQWQSGVLSFLCGFLVAFLLQSKMSMVKITTPTTIIAKEETPHRPNSNAHIQCTADMLTNTTNPWSFFNETGELQWRISDQGKRACGALSFVKPLQSTPKDIHNALQNKWLLMIGDSSVRMLHDYLVGRWFGGYTHWPSKLTNHGPPEHTVPCREPFVKMRQGIPYAPPECKYDVFWGGARVTFVWFALDLSEALPKLLQSTVGSPDMVVAQHGYWEKSSGRDPSILAQTAPQNITAMLDHLEMESVYKQAYTQSSSQKRVWMSLFDSVYGSYDGSTEAKDLGWEIFDRTRLTSFDSKEAVGPHPMNEVLEVELELLLVLIHATQARNEVMDIRNYI